MAQKDDTDLSDSDLDPEHQPPKKDPNVEKGQITESSNKNSENTEMADAGIGYSDFDPKNKSSLEKDERDFKAGHHSTDEIKLSKIPGGTASPSEINEIVQETNEFLDLCLKKVLSQEKAFTSMVYRLYNMNSDLITYKTFVDQYHRFAVNYSPIFDEYFKNLSQALPLYGDFNVALFTQDVDWREDAPPYFAKHGAQELIRKLRLNCYGGGMTLRSQNLTVRDVYHWIPARLSTINRYESKQPLILELMESSIIQLKKLVDRIIRLKAHLHYLMIDETRRPAADYSKLVS